MKEEKHQRQQNPVEAHDDSLVERVAGKAVEEQLAKGGIRLAMVLNQLWP